MLHGLAKKQAGGVELRFGFVTLLGYVWSSQLHIPQHTSTKWPFRRIDNGFTHLQMAARDLIFKTERAASLYAQKAREHSVAVLNLDVGPRQEDLSILLDAIVVYLRVLPDLMAAVTPYFYPRGVPSGRGFREQITWFTKKRSNFDPTYTNILKTKTEWFELLAGKEEKGLRDLLIHRFGKFQFPVTTAPHAFAGEVSADLVTMSGYHGDAHISLSRIMHGLAEFLDIYVMHFNERLKVDTGWAPFIHGVSDGSKIRDFHDMPDSSWLLPILH